MLRAARVVESEHSRAFHPRHEGWEAPPGCSGSTGSPAQDSEGAARTPRPQPWEGPASLWLRRCLTFAVGFPLTSPALDLLTLVSHCPSPGLRKFNKRSRCEGTRHSPHGHLRLLFVDLFLPRRGMGGRGREPGIRLHYKLVRCMNTRTPRPEGHLAAVIASISPSFL